MVEKWRAVGGSVQERQGARFDFLLGHVRTTWSYGRGHGMAWDLRWFGSLGTDDPAYAPSIAGGSLVDEVVAEARVPSGGLSLDGAQRPTCATPSRHRASPSRP